jgi:hypothetical protein
MGKTKVAAVFTIVSLFALTMQVAARAEEGQETNPSAALTSALLGACRQNEAAFARYLTADNAAAYLKLPEEQRRELMKRLVLVSDAGRPLLSSDADGNTIIRCSSPSVTAELRLGKERVRENLAFVPLDIDGRQVEIGLVREGGGWRLLSVGLLLLDIPALQKQWEVAELEAREEAAMAALRRLAAAIRQYREAFGALPEQLEQLGPAKKEGVSPERAQLVEEELASGIQGGYRFRYRILPAPDANSPPGFELAATPVDYGRTGRRSFFLDAEGRMRGGDKQGAVATSADPLVEPRASRP